MTWAFDLGKNSFNFGPSWEMKALKRFMWRTNILLFAFTMSSKVRNSTWPSPKGLWNKIFHRRSFSRKIITKQKHKTCSKMNLHWENNKAREKNNSQSYLRDLVVSGKQYFFQVQTNFLSIQFFHHNLSLKYGVVFPMYLET